MVPVRKPGRPLSTCPHPPARGCGCGSVTAAIPRKQKCGCGSSTAGTPTESSATSSVVKAESPASDAPPMSPTKAPAASFRVQKPAAKAASRKQSFDPANLERMDAAHVNILPPYDMAQANALPHANGMAGMQAPRPGMEYGAMSMMGAVNGGFHQPIIVNSEHSESGATTSASKGIKWRFLLRRRSCEGSHCASGAYTDNRQHRRLMLRRSEQK
ncbi:copper fist DNA binding domain-containing protein [Colletotrichum gloeosporioides Cg-14]|uniref:Copper fist DNA binding domain-containing protein n=1 Tax=Colletotrichum gloeosporioides (strain Cg-14) TaxID=1237896 RepID=T0JY26_COLGC|nr:copper fist DNA binding domain-containing protein [Colletotrichum gloeosporioides Cg-14]